MLSGYEKNELAELLDIVLQTSEFTTSSGKVNDLTAQRAEEMMEELIFCTSVFTALFAAIRCVPKSLNVGRWLIGCLPAVLNAVKQNQNQLITNLSCHSSIRIKHYSNLVLSLEGI